MKMKGEKRDELAEMVGWEGWERQDIVFVFGICRDDAKSSCSKKKNKREKEKEKESTRVNREDWYLST